MKDKNIHINQGSYWELGIIVYSSDGITRANITGRTFQGQIRSSYDAVDPPVAEMDFTLTDPENGEAIAFLSSTDTAAIPVDASGGGTERKIKTYIYDIEMTTDSKPRRIAQGKALVSPEVTKD